MKKLLFKKYILSFCTTGTIIILDPWTEKKPSAMQTWLIVCTLQMRIVSGESIKNVQVQAAFYFCT